MRADLSIIIVAMNDRPRLQRYLQSVLSLADEATCEVLVIDNASSDGTAGWMFETYPEVRMIVNHRPLSYAENVNIGIEAQANGRYVMIGNPDVRCLPGLAREAITFLDANADVGLMGPRLLEIDGRIQTSARRFSTPGSMLLRGLRIDRYVRLDSVDRFLMIDELGETPRDVDWVFGALMIARREAIDSVGGMDPRFSPLHWEDQDWCAAMWRGGWRVCYVPSAIAIHEHQRHGARRPFSRLGRAKVLNGFRLLRKYGGSPTRNTEA